MRRRQRFVVWALAGLLFFSGLGAAGTVFVEKAIAASCSNPPVFLNRACWRGFYKNQLDTAGPDVRIGGVPSSVNTIGEFRSMIEGDLSSGNAQRRTGAQFIIHTMIGVGAGATKNVTSTQLNEWRERLHGYGNVSENGSRSTGTSGYIDWFVSWHIPCDTPNTFYQDAHDDVAPYVDTPSNSNCEIPSVMDSFIYFRNSSGGIIAKIRRDCMNPVGNLGSLASAPSFNMTGSTTVNGGTSAQVLPGDTVQFRHSLTNSGPEATSPVSINWNTRNQGGTTIASGNAGTFTNGQLKNVGAEDYVVPASATPGTLICRNIRWTPDTFFGGEGSSTTRCATVAYSYDLEPRINVTIRDADGQDVTSGGVAEPGYTIEFRYSVNNSGITESQSVTCTYRQDTHAGYDTSAPTTGFTPAGASCPPDTVFPRNSTTSTAAETVSGGAIAANTTICRSFTVSPATQSGGSATTLPPSCIPVVAKPYTRVYGGDVAVGNGFSDSLGVCAHNTNASAVGWNRGSAGNFAGSGAQYAVNALNAVQEFASALSTTGSGAPAPAGLTFSNTVGVDIANGDFGGFFGAASCVKDYYGARPGATTSLGAAVNLTSLGSGVYERSGNLELNGGGSGANVNPGEEIVIYVDGNVQLNSNITYPGSWNSGNIPRFTLIATGNIFIDGSVGEINGVFIAQGSGASGGTIYTCASGAAPALDGSLFGSCNNKLIVNGAFIARQVQLLRTSGTLSSSNRSDGSPSGGASAEVINFNPALWINQPADATGNSGEYDSVISLPPIL